MATHTAVLIKTESPSNGAISFRGRCCGDPKSDVTHTLYFRADTTDQAVEQEVQDHLRRTEALHAAAERVNAVLAKYQGESNG